MIYSGQVIKLRQDAEMNVPTALETKECPPHYSLLNRMNVGKCFKCGVEQDFSEKKPPPTSSPADAKAKADEPAEVIRRAGWKGQASSKGGKKRKGE